MDSKFHIPIYTRTEQWITFYIRIVDEATDNQTHFRDYIISRGSTQASNRYGRMNTQYSMFRYLLCDDWIGRYSRTSKHRKWRHYIFFSYLSCHTMTIILIWDECLMIHTPTGCVFRLKLLIIFDSKTKRQVGTISWNNNVRIRTTNWTFDFIFFLKVPHTCK